MTSNSLPKSQTPIFLPLKSAGLVMFELLPRHGQGARALEDLGDVDQVGGGVADSGLEDLGHPADREFGAVGGGAGCLRDDVRAAGHDRQLDPGRVVVALLDRREVARELGLRRPLELEPDLGRGRGLRTAPASLGARRAGRGLAGCRSLGAVVAPPLLQAANRKLADAASARNLRVFVILSSSSRWPAFADQGLRMVVGTPTAGSSGRSVLLRLQASRSDACHGMTARSMATVAR